MLWLTALHVMAFAAWMAGMWYMPRLLVYHATAVPGSEFSEALKVMERRLLRAIATPAMVITLVAGLVLATWGDLWSQGWLHAKLVLVVAMGATHGVIAREIRLVGMDQRPHGARYYRILNEVPTVLFIGIVVLAIVQPF